MSFNNMLFSVPDWIAQSFPTIRIVLFVLITVLSLALIFVVLFQPGNDGSFGALGGSEKYETFYSKNKSQSVESLLKRLTVILGIAIAVLAVVFLLMLIPYIG